MTSLESRRLEVDIAAHNTIDIPPSNDEAKNDTALVDAFDVVANPGDSVRDTGVDAQGAEETASVLHMRVCAPKQHAEAHDSNHRDDDVAHAALASAVCKEPD